MSDLFFCSLCGTFVLALLVLLVSGYLLYSGLLSEIHISTGSPPIESITVAYKYTQRSSKDIRLLLAESLSIAPELPTITVYYDDPKKVSGTKCRCAVGSILSEGGQKPSAELQELYEQSDFQIFTFPEVTHVVSSSFPYRTVLCFYLGMHRVYPQLDCYIKERKLCAHPFLEIYKGHVIHYMSPLARQGDFYVPEVQESPKRQQEGEESEEDRRTDITGPDSYSDCSSVSRRLPSDSRDSSLSRCPSVLYQNRRDSESAEYRGSDSDGRRSRRSSSASSFEELDMENCVTHYQDSDKICQCPGLVVEGEE